MSIRAQLVVAFLVLSILPLTAIVLYNYYSSLDVVHELYEAEAARVAKQMDQRLAAVTSGIRDEIGSAFSQFSVKDFEAQKALVQKLGADAPLIESFEFVPDPQAVAEGIAEAETEADIEPKLDVEPVIVDVQKILADIRASGATVTPEMEAQIARQRADASERVARKLEELRQRKRPRPPSPPAESRRVMILGHPVDLPVFRGGQIVGRVKAELSARDVLHRVLASAKLEEGEMPFAIDKQGEIYTIDEDDRRTLQSIDVRAEGERGDWVVEKSVDKETGVTFGIARPIQQPLHEIRKNAGRNFAYGLGLIGLALLGIIPIANHMTRDVALVTKGAERIAQGDLQTRVPVLSRGELGKLAEAFNRMAHDLSEHQLRLFREKELRGEQELREKLLAAEYERKSDELEEARRFQLSLLPKELPSHPSLRFAAHVATATEVGGDYYDFLVADGAITLAIGDATGHGARAGTMVTIVKSLFSHAGDRTTPREFLREAADTIKRMELGRMAMGLTIARLTARSAIVAAAGMPPILLRRESVEEISIEGMPLGTLAYDYKEIEIALEPGDTLLLMTDGLPELANAAGEPFGYDSVARELAAVGDRDPDAIASHLAAVARQWSGSAAPSDDITLLVVKVGSRIA